MPPYRILVVDDSAFMRKFISDIISSDEAFDVVGIARNGREGIQAIKELRPDAVTMDLEMPEMTGLEALPILMKEAPTPVIMLSSSTQEGTSATIRALELGAFDFVAKPTGALSAEVERVKLSLLSSLREATAVKKEEVIERLQPQVAPSPTLKPSAPLKSAPLFADRTVESAVDFKPRAKPKPPDRKLTEGRDQPKAELKPTPLKSDLVTPLPNRSDQQKPASRANADQHRSITRGSRASHSAVTQLVAIGTSTGGPRALQQVLTKLPAELAAPVLIVQHMPPGFTKSLAQRLNTICEIEVVEAEDGMEPMPGTAYIAPGGVHMVLKKEAGKLKLRLTDDPLRSGHRPSVDELFESLALFPELERTIVLMTGMGSDGAKGMKQLHELGVKGMIAEDQSTCIVYGMPRAAVELGCVTHLIPLDRIAEQITKAVTQPKEV